MMDDVENGIGLIEDEWVEKEIRYTKQKDKCRIGR